ncbi:hypothetical protein D1871_04610 [Nakamurella silvestris]|nr:hypothetical protein D1871_04610 [Nakamurella silvestris]
MALRNRRTTTTTSDDPYNFDLPEEGQHRPSTRPPVNTKPRLPAPTKGTGTPAMPAGWNPTGAVTEPETTSADDATSPLAPPAALPRLPVPARGTGTPAMPAGWNPALPATDPDTTVADSATGPVPRVSVPARGTGTPAMPAGWNPALPAEAPTVVAEPDWMPLPPVPVDEPTPAAQEEEPQVWGSAPVPMHFDPAGARPVVVPQWQPPVFQPSPSDIPSYPVAELINATTRDRARRVARIRQTPWPGPRRVLVASLFGGTGRSTTAALIWASTANLGLSVTLLDATGDWQPGLFSRTPESWIGPSPTWADLDGQEPAAISGGFAAMLPTTISGPAPLTLVTARERGKVPSPQVVATTAWAAAASWPLVITDVAGGYHQVWEAATVGQPDVLVMTCRPDPAELRETAEFLRVLHRSRALDCSQSAVVAVSHTGSDLPHAVKAARAAAADVAAGVIGIRHSPHLANRQTTVDPQRDGPTGDLLAAIIATSPTPLHTTTP